MSRETAPFSRRCDHLHWLMEQPLRSLCIELEFKRRNLGYDVARGLKQVYKAARYLIEKSACKP